MALAAAVGLLVGCSVDTEDMATTFFDPTSNPSGNPPATSSPDETQGPETDGSGPGGSGPGDTGMTSMPMSDSDGGSTGAPPVDEQPADGMYSECTTVADCIGLTACVQVAGAAGGGYCTSGCADASTCAANPGATSNATPSCIDDGTGMTVCALSCAGGLACPGGMDCLAFAGTMVCA